MIDLPFEQTLVAHDLATVGLLIVLEGVLSIDNALVLGLLANRLPKRQQGRALTYGLVGAFAFRIIAIAAAQYLLQWKIVKVVGGAYLLYVALKHFFFEEKSEDSANIQIGPDGHPILPAEGEGASEVGRKFAGFWSTVLVIELTDIAFAVDSILAAIALVGDNPNGTGVHPKLWVVITGGMLGVVLMRFAAVVFIKLLEKFPRFEISAYLLVAVIGLKLLLDWLSDAYEPVHFWINFHDYKHPSFWAFWTLMIGALGYGFLPVKRQEASAG
ncbi:MAG: hypothetical protein U0939_14075 [Pirellulales bacterium]